VWWRIASRATANTEYFFITGVPLADKKWLGMDSARSLSYRLFMGELREKRILAAALRINFAT
jgi:hypothetical protein